MRRVRKPTGNHDFEKLCPESGTEHRLTQPMTPKTNGLVEHLTGPIGGMLKNNRFLSTLDQQPNLVHYASL